MTDEEVEQNVVLWRDVRLYLESEREFLEQMRKEDLENLTLIVRESFCHDFSLQVFRLEKNIEYCCNIWAAQL